MNALAPRLLTLALLPAAFLAAQDQGGESLYQKNCAQCHDAGVGRAPAREAFRQMTPEQVVAAMETGPMISMAVNIQAEGRRAIATFVTGKQFGHPLVTTPSA